MRVDEAYALLSELDALPRLIRHAELVSEGAEILITHFSKLDVELDAELVRVGCILHDIGKIVHPEELEKEGIQHTVAGYGLLIKHGIEPRIANFCLSHEQWQADSTTLESLTVALADKLWKGKQQKELETGTIQKVSTITGRDFWELFLTLDAVFEVIADNSSRRLARSIE